MNRPIDRRSFLATTAAGALAAATPALAQAGSEDARLRARLDAMFEALVDDSPRFATSLGLDKDKRAALKSQLDDNSQAGRDRRLERSRRWVRELKAI
ncbi:MAG TPA: twin-arginine translocation signal domain-containing protein, partial [Phenylobacterium sp.]|nr:twin-arginine translocation signal domain-containing protein [Phenylobacterium sp.]